MPRLSARVIRERGTNWLFAINCNIQDTHTNFIFRYCTIQLYKLEQKGLKLEHEDYSLK